MKKFDTFQAFARGAKSLVAILLVMLMAVGSLFAEEYTVVITGMYSTTTTFSNPNEVVALNDNFSFSLDKQSATNNPAFFPSGDLRLYAEKNSGLGCAMTLFPATGITITGIEITATAADRAPQVAYIVDGASDVETITVGDTLTYVISNINAATSFKFYNNFTGSSAVQLRISKIKIIYTTSTPEPPTPIVVAAPTFAPEAGTYTAAQNVTIACTTDGAAIYYTIDGTTPTANSTLYENAINITETTTINAIAIVGETASDVATATYTINLTPDEPEEPTVLNLDSIATLPYVYNFDDGVDPYFMINNGEATNKWFIGQAQTFDNKKLYISSNNGTTNKYDVTKASNVIAYRDVMIPATGAVLSFDYRVNGEGVDDYLEIDLVTDAMTYDIASLHGENEWASFHYDISGEMAGLVRLQFHWRNDGDGQGNQFPAAIDNISIIETPCSQPTALTATVDSTTAVITWQAVEGQTAWNFQYKLADHSEWYNIPVTDTTYTLNDLQGNSNYEMRVQAVCGENVSAWTNGTFAVACQSETVVTTSGDVEIGTYTTTNSYLPFYGLYNYSYSQQIIDAEEINASTGNIYSVTFDCSTAPASTSTGNIKIWMANTTKSVFDNNTDYIDPSTLTLVYTGPASYAYQVGLNTFTFDTPFEYTGGNVVIAYYEGNGSYNSGSFRVHSTTDHKSIMHYSDTQGYVSYENPASASGTKQFPLYRDHMILNMDITVVTCDDQIACATPTGLQVSDITPNSAVLTWTAGDENQSSFIVEYMAEGATEWTSVDVNDTTYTLTELAQLTNYSVKVKANCGTNNWSDVITSSFRTEGNCAPVTNLETSNMSNTTTLTWTAGGEESAWLVQFKPASENEDAWTSINVSLIPMTTFGGLVGNVDYDVRVKALCDPENEENQSEWASTTFHSGCAAFDLPFSEEFAASTMPTCWENSEFHFSSYSDGYAYSYTNGAELISPAINIPAENPTYLSFEVRGSGDYTILASYRGTRADRFAQIYTGTAPNQNTIVTIAIDDLYKGRAVNFKIVNNSTSYQYFYNVIVNQCPFEVAALTTANITGTALDLTWEANEAATNFQVQYGEAGFTLGEGTTVDVTDTTAVTITGLNYETAYDFYVRVVCAGDNGAWFGPVAATTAPACSDPTFTEHEFNNGSLMVFWTAGEWGTPSLYNVRYKGIEEAEYTYTTVTPVVMPGYTPFVTISGLASNATYEIGVQSVCGENMESNWVNMEVTTPCMPLAIPYTQDFEGDVFPPECWSQIYVTGTIDWELTSNAATFNDNSYDANQTKLLTPTFDLSSATRDVVLSFKHQQPDWGGDQDELRVYYRPSASASWVLLAAYTESITTMTSEEITLPAAALTSSCQIAFEGTGGYGYGITLDDVMIDFAPSCGTPSIAVTGLNVTITPNTQYGDPTAYEITIEGQSQIVTNTTFDVTSIFPTLPSDATYQMSVRAICGDGDTSSVATAEVNIPFICQGTIAPYAVGTGTATNSYLPSYSYYNYSLTQQLYTADEIGVPEGGHIYSLSFDITGAKERNIDIYVGTTTATSLSSWITDANFTKVYSGTAFASTGINEFNFSSQIAYNGTDNIVVMVVDNTGSWVSGLNAKSHTGATNKARYVYNDNNSYNPQSPSGGTITSTRNNIVFNICPNPVACATPKNITVGNVTETTADVSWTAGGSETEWEVSYTLNGQDVTETTTNNPYTITGLSASTHYVLPFSVKAICSETEESAVVSTNLTFNTVCIVMDLPLVEDFESDVFPSACWTSYKVSGSGSYNWASTTTAHGGSHAAYVRDQSATTIHNLVTPQLNIPSAGAMLTFWVKRESNYNNKTQEGVKVLYSTDPEGTAAVEALYVHRNYTLEPAETAAGWYEYTTTIPQGQYYVIFQGINEYGGATTIDDINIDVIPTCFVPTALTVSEVSDHSAELSWTDNHNQTNFAVEYRADNENGWTTVNVDTTYYLLSNLNASTEYFVRVKAVCGTDDESNYTEEVAFSTFCQSGTSYTNVGTGTASTSAYYPVYNGSNYSYSQQIFTAEEINVPAGQISSLAIEYNYATAMTAKNDVKIYLANTDKQVFANTSDWVTDGMQLVYEGALNCQQGWNEFAFTTPFTYDGHNLVVVMEDLSGNYNSSSYNFKTTNAGSGIYRTMYYYNSYNPFSGGTANSRVTYRTNMRFDVCPEATDLAITEVNNFADACDVEGAVTIGVKNNGYEGTVSTFEAYYQVNEETPVHETVTLATPIAFDEAATYTFSMLPAFAEGANTLTAWVVLDGDAVEANNSIVTEVTVLAPATVPYVENFTGLTINHGWNPIDANNDGITMNLNNDINYTFNDELAADDWMMSPCIEMTAGTYTIIYDYKANSSLTEAFEVFYGNGNHVADMTNAVATHSFNNTTYETASTTITIAADGIYNFGFHATSLAGNLGFSIDNFKVYPVNDVVVTYAENGTVTPNGIVAVNYGENLTLNIVPDPMYHVGGIEVDGVQVVPEDGTGANFMLYTLENVTEPHTVFVDFKLEFHIFKTVENYRSDLYSDLGGAFVPAATDTTIDPTPFTVNMVADPHYFLAGLTISPMVPDMPEDVFAGVVDNGDGTYSYTIDTLVVANYYLNATFRRDTVAINYNVMTGKGYANDSQLLNAGDTYTTWVDYSVNHDVDTTVTFTTDAPYHVADVIVNGVAQGHIDSYTFQDVTEAQNVDIKYGYKIDASVVNYNTYDDIDINVPQGTITPATQYIPEYDAMTVTGTVEEHFHLYQLLVNGENRIDEVVFGADPHNYSFTMDSVDNNYTIVAMVKVDTFAIVYNVLAGQGYADASGLLVEGDSYSTILNYGDNWYSNIEPATGYSIENVTLDGQNLYTANNYQFNYIEESHVFDVTFVANTYTVTTNAYGNGTVSEGMTFTYNPDSAYNYEFTATAAEGYHITSVVINNEEMEITDPANFTYTIENVADNYLINAYFAINTYTMTGAAFNYGGTITPSGTQIVNYGADVVYTINANEGYYISETSIDGESTSYTQADAVNTLDVPFTNINDNHEVIVAFLPYMYTITSFVDGGHGNINVYSDTLTEIVQYGNNLMLTFDADDNYQVADVVIDGVSMGAITSYEFINITANHNVVVTFEAIMYTLTATSNIDACTITPATTTVQAGSNVAYTLTVANGYHLVNVVANGEEVVVANNAFTISDVQSDYTIFANFAPNYVTVTVDQPAHATITPGTMTYAYGATPSYMIVPEVGYEVVSVTAGDAIVNVTYNNGIGTFTLDALTQDITLTATVSIKKFEITVTQGANGTIAPGTQTNVEYGSNKTFTITPNDYYVVADVIVDGSSRGALSSYTFYNVTGNHTITAVFEANCQTPTNLTAMNIDTSSAVLSWVGTATSYEVRYKAADEASYTTQTATTTSLQLTGLTPNTLYEYGVRAVCGANLTSDWATNAFTTRAVPVDPTVGIANADMSSIKVYSFQNNVYIVNEDGIAISNVDIYDIYGKQVYTGKVLSSPEVISLSVANGNYVVRLATENGVGVYKVAIVR